MAKKTSAASKGYRKTKKAKPFLTKKEIIALCIIVAVVLIGAIVINAIPNVGLIRASQIQTGDIISMGKTSTDNRYKKLGVVNEVEGYTLEAKTSSETPTSGYYFYPVDESSPLKHLRIGGAIYDASTGIDTSMSWRASIDPARLGEKVPSEIGGSTAYISSTIFEEYLDPASGGDPVSIPEGSDLEPNVFTQYIYCYVDTDGEYSISMTACRQGEDASVFLPDDQLAEYMSQFEGFFTPAEE